NLGVMSWVDDRGVEVLRDESAKASTMIATPKLRPSSLTLYGRWGDWPITGLLGIAVLGFAWRERRRGGAAPSAGNSISEKNEADASDETRVGSS
ncbi:MAG TPA: hypothetical protein PKA58_15140, partial [Polyangium sp.]|nr:hypothetical protein [Polyangium sp.]